MLKIEGKSKLKYELKKKLKLLKGFRGSGTEMISVYIPPGSAIFEMSNKLKEEYGQASNIKSKSTRKNVMDALDKIINYLKIFKSTPENGIAIFCGNVSEREGRPDTQLFSIVPHEPLKTQLYRCDSTFFLEPLESLIEAKDSFGLVVMDGREATLAILKGKNISIVKRLNSTAHAKVRKGGQSARRYERLIEEAIEKYYIRVGEAMDTYFLASGLKGIIVGGPGPAKDNFFKAAPWNYQFKILGVVDTGYTDEYGIQELLEKASDIMAKQEATLERELVQKFIREVVREGLATYGYKQVKEALEQKKVSLLLVSDGLELSAIKAQCPKCGQEKELVHLKGNPLPACSCGSTMMNIKEEADALDILTKMAADQGVEVESVSNDTPDGHQFLQSFYGLGAFLRYK
ncbi:Peptide chain release factor subunit 1 [Candidatus Gugararchaeum adminiculabundum]|nr:Peptide chain release factor subunit 1 [Candidatus Gugararchaeum adminiculabundum]